MNIWIFKKKKHLTTYLV